MFGLVWRSPKSLVEVIIALSLVWYFKKGISCRGRYASFGWVWFGGHQNQLQRSPLHCPWSGIFKKVYHLGLNIDYLGCLHWRSHWEVTMISCSGHPNQLQMSSLHCPWCGIFKKVQYVGVNMHCLFWFGFEVTKISCRGHQCNVLVLGFSKRYNM